MDAERQGSESGVGADVSSITQDSVVKILFEQGSVNIAQLRRAAAGRGTQTILETLVERRFATEEQVARALAKHLQVPFIDLERDSLPPSLEGHIDQAHIDQGVLPVRVEDKKVTFAIDLEIKAGLKGDLEFGLGGKEAAFAVATTSALRKMLGRYGSRADLKSAALPVVDREEEQSNSPTVRLAKQYLLDAIRQGASDVTLSPEKNEFVVQFCIDGVQRPVARITPAVGGGLVSYLKVCATPMDIAEKRLPQDSSFVFSTDRGDVDIRVATYPAQFGEAMTLRVLDQTQGIMSLSELGLNKSGLQTFERLISQPNGIILATGPTGSGKTTTLYSMLVELQRTHGSEKRILTAEDPIECVIPGVVQAQINENIGFTFARALRAMLRQHPNVILVGEIRDQETAEIAVQAANTGHLVFSTLHTNDAPSAVTRLVNMGIPAFMVAESLIGTVSQRLVRKLCSDCAVNYEASGDELEALGLNRDEHSGATLKEAVGCDCCNHSGYRGMTGLFETIEMTDALADILCKEQGSSALRKQALEDGQWSPILLQGAEQALAGITSFAELKRVVKLSNFKMSSG